jgi:hypothetical protein
MILKSKIHNIYLQFGFKYLINSVIKRLLSPIVKKTSFYVLAIEDHTPSKNKEEIFVVDNKTIDVFFKTGIKVNKQLERQLLSFLPHNQLAVIIKKDNQIAGWGFIQQTGFSKYASYNYRIPESTHLIKNLFVETKFRGQSIGKQINIARINIIPKGITPTVFVIPSNKYAIRNLEMYGFKKQLLVKDYLWFNIYHLRTFKIIIENLVTNLIITGFKNE